MDPGRGPGTRFERTLAGGGLPSSGTAFRAGRAASLERLGRPPGRLPSEGRKASERPPPPSQKAAPSSPPPSCALPTGAEKRWRVSSEQVAVPLSSGAERWAQNCATAKPWGS